MTGNWVERSLGLTKRLQQQALRRIHLKKFLVTLSITLLAAVASCPGQIGNATISGQVTDNQGAVIPNAKITATETTTGVSTPVVTNSVGYYTVTNLNVGNYSLAVEAQGFQRYERKGLTLTTSEVLGLDVKLNIGSVDQTVEVTTGAPLVETKTSDVTQFIEEKSIDALPLGNRKTLNIIQTIGAAVFLNDNVGGSQPTYSLAGGRVQSQMTFLDGGLTQNFRIAAPQQSIDPPIEVIKEIQVIESTYPAQYGASGGGVVIESSKSGTNRLHGSAYEYLRNDAADAKGYFALTKPELRYNIFGATVGGPIKRDKAFFFFGFEGVRLNQGSTSTLTVPTAQERGGNFSDLYGSKTSLGIDPCDGSTIVAGQIYDPTTTRVVNGTTCRNAFSGNIVTAPSQDSVGAKVLSYYPTPTNSAFTNNFTGNMVTLTHTNYYFIKVDDELTRKDHLLGRYMFYENNIDATSFYPDRGADPNSFPDGGTTIVYASLTHTFDATKVNNFGFSYYRRTGNQFSYSHDKGYPAMLGLNGVPSVSFPSFAPAGGYQALGTGSQGNGSLLTQEQYLDDFTWVLGKHTIKLGGEFRGSRGQGISDEATSSGSFNFATQTTGSPTPSGVVAGTGSGLASLLVGAPNGFSISNGLPTDRRGQYMAGYVQDDWSASQRLTLNYGLRWEIDLPETDARNRLNGFNASQINPVSGTPGVVKFAGLDYPNTIQEPNFSNFSPRLGFALKPFNDDNTVIRGGFGIYFGPPIDNTTWAANTLGYSSQATLNSPDNIGSAPFYLRSGVPAVALASPVLSDSYGAVAAPYTNANTTVTYYPRIRKQEYDDQFNLTVEHQFNSTLVLSVSGLGNLGRRLSSSNEPIDQISPVNLAALAAGTLSTKNGTQQYRPFPQFSGVTQVAPAIGNSNYYGGVVKIEKRFSRGFNFVSTYTQAKLLSDTNDNANASAGSLGNNNGPYSNYYNRYADYGRAENDIERRFTFNSVYELPFGPGKQFANGHSIVDEIVGGWSITNLTTVQSGAAETAITNTNNTNAFSSGSQRPNLGGNPNLPRGSRGILPTKPWFNTSLFSQPAPYTFGNEGVGVINAPGYVDSDLTLLRRISLPEGIGIELRADAFNFLNHTNFNPANVVYGASNFGSVTSIRPNSQRELEVGARISF